MTDNETSTTPPSRDELEWALEHVDRAGFGDLVDADSTIEDAARAYLAGLISEERYTS